MVLIVRSLYFRLIGYLCVRNHQYNGQLNMEISGNSASVTLRLKLEILPQFSFCWTVFKVRPKNIFHVQRQQLYGSSVVTYVSDRETIHKDWKRCWAKSLVKRYFRIHNIRACRDSILISRRRHQKDVIKWELSALLALCESTGHWWISLTKASDAELWCFLWSAPEKKIEQTPEKSVIWDAIELIMTLL